MFSLTLCVAYSLFLSLCVCVCACCWLAFVASSASFPPTNSDVIVHIHIHIFVMIGSHKAYFNSIIKTRNIHLGISQKQYFIANRQQYCLVHKVHNIGLI